MEAFEAACRIMKKSDELIIITVVEEALSSDWADPDIAMFMAEGMIKINEGLERDAKQLLDSLSKLCMQRGLKHRLLQLKSDSRTAILKTAEDEKVDLIVVGSRGLGAIKRFLLGSVSDHIVRYANCPVLVVRQGEGIQPGQEDTIGSSEVVDSTAE